MPSNDKLAQHLATHGESAAIASYKEDDDRHGWNHPQCYPCWFKRWGLTREPVRYVHGTQPLTCCFCGNPTASGIYIRVRPGSGIIAFCADTGIDVTLFRAPKDQPRS